MRVLPSRVPFDTTGTIAPPAALSVATCVAVAPAEKRRRRRPSSEPQPEIAAYRRCVREGLRAASVPRAIELAIRRGVRP